MDGQHAVSTGFSMFIENSLGIDLDISFGFYRYQLTCRYTLLHIAAVIYVATEYFIFPRGFRLLKSRFASASKRSEPSSRTILIGEQPNPWELLHPRDMVSRHRGAELRRRCGRLGGTSLLSPE